MELTDSEKVQTLLFLHKFQFDEILRREEREQKWFEWAASSILAAFGVVLALSGNATPIPHPIAIKTIATILITLPTILIISRMFWQRNINAENAEAVENIQDALNVFKENYYGVPGLYRKEWEGKLAKSHRERKVPYYYAGILILMVSCVISTIWVVL